MAEKRISADRLNHLAEHAAETVQHQHVSRKAVQPLDRRLHPGVSGKTSVPCSLCKYVRIKLTITNEGQENWVR